MTIIQVREVDGVSGRCRTKIQNGRAWFFLVIFIMILLLTIGVGSGQPDPGSSWTSATGAASFPARSLHSSVVFLNSLWVIGGQDFSANFFNDVWNSTDGSSWTQETSSAAFPARSGHSSVVFDNKLWVIGGQGNSGLLHDVWYSTDGVTWTQATDSAAFTARWGHTSVVFDNKMWVIGGYTDDGSGNYAYANDVWYSTDGISWTQVPVTTAFPARNFHTSVVFDNRMWVIGGNSDTQEFNDVWSSPDGAVWTEETSSAFDSGRFGLSSVADSSGMWAIAGSGNSVTLQEVWNSTDGVTWSETTGSAPFPGRQSHTSVIFDNRIWVIAGAGTTQSYNDVWYSSFSAAPIVSAITPASGSSTGLIAITDIAGTSFVSGATVTLNRTGSSDIAGTNVTVVSPTRITCTFDLTGATPGDYNVIVTNPDGQSGTLTDGFTITMNAPVVTGVNPPGGVNNGSVSITDLSGSNFVAGANVMLNRTGYPGVLATGVAVVSPAKITCTVELTGLQPGQYNVVVTNPDLQQGMLTNGFTVTEPSRVVTSFTATTSIRGLTISGNPGSQYITVDAGTLPSALIPNASVLEIQPPTDRGLGNITVYALDGTGFSRNGNTITGRITSVHIESANLSPSGYSSLIGPSPVISYAFDLPSYPENAVLTTEVAEGTTAADHDRLLLIAAGNHASYLGTAYTVQIIKTNLPAIRNAVITMSINADWDPSFHDGQSQVFIEHITDRDEVGEVLHTRYLYHDPATNLNYYEAASPRGLSTFTLSDLSGNNNPFQLIVLIAASYVKPSGGEEATVATTVPAPAATVNVTAEMTGNATSPAPPMESRSALLYTNADGVITQETTLRSSDGLVMVTVDAGVTAKDREGKPLALINLTPVAARALPGKVTGDGLTFSGRAVDLKPEGAVFSPAISVVFRAPADVRFGQEFAVQYYDPATGTWHEVPAVYNSSTMTISAQVSHFCCLALFERTVSAEPSTIVPAATHPQQPVATPQPANPSTAVGIFAGLMEWMAEMSPMNIILVIVIVIIAAVLVIFIRKRQRYW